jgi:ribose transport system substrate-binding protein
MRSRRNWASIIAAVLAVAVAACGDSSDSSGTKASSADGAGGQASAPKPPTSPPKTIPITEPLDGAPAKGKTLHWLQCELPICDKIGQGVKAGASAVGWNVKAQVFKSADPGGGLTSALQGKPDAIAITGIPSAAVKPQLDAAAKAGIPVLTCGVAEQPTPTTYAAACGTTTGPDGEDLAKWAINDSGGDAHIVSVTIPSFPSLKTTTDGTAKAVEQYCGKCSTDVLGVTVDDLGSGQVASKLVAYLQAHPDVNYVLFTFADLEAGVAQALKAAGLAERVKLIGNGGGEPQFEGVIAGGADKAWQAYPAVMSGWMIVDAAARLVSGGELPDGYQKQLDHLPTYVVENPASAKALAPSYDWQGPADYQAQFKELWNVG